MISLLEAVDELNHALRLFQGVELAVAGMSDGVERKALAAVLYEAIRELENGIGVVEAVRTGGAS